jgi:TonB-linked SusC/RagA family outer membrane protein
MKRIVFIGFLLLMMLGTQAFGQVRRITGTVTDASDGTSLPGVSIVVQGTTQGTVTDINGRYEINAAGDAVLVFSFIGMEPQEIPVQNRNVINVSLQPELVGLEEVIVIAYGTTRRESFTGVADVISADKIERRQVSNVTRALEGTSPGIQVTSGGGQPGSGAAVRLRGFGSVNASNAPLYVVDGVPFDGTINSINPDDIASITVLRDASAAALYGARGANGVIMITTKSGSVRRPSMNFTSRVGLIDRTLPEYPMVNSEDFMLLSWEAYRNFLHFNQGLAVEDANMVALQGGMGYSSTLIDFLGNYNPFTLPEGQQLITWDASNPWRGTFNPNAQLLYQDNWQDELFSTALRQDYGFNVSGGSETSDYYLSLGYLNEEGMVVNSNFERITARLNMNTQPTTWFKTGLNISGALTSTSQLLAEGTYTTNPFFYTRMMGPIYPVYVRDDQGQHVLDESGQKILDYGFGAPEYGVNRTRPYAGNSNLVGTLTLDDRSFKHEAVGARTYALFDIVQGLTFRMNLSTDYYSRYTTTFQNPQFGDAANVGGRGTKAHSRNLSVTFNQLLNYNRQFGDHNFDALLGHESYQMLFNYASATRTNFPIPGLNEIGVATTMEGSTSYAHEYTIEGYFARLSYDFQNRYYLSASYRADGSSRFHEDIRWGSFYSFGASWRVTQEDFMQGIDWLDNLRLKASYGEQGNDQLLTAGGANMYYAWQSFYNLGYDNNIHAGAIYSQHENRNLQWEVSRNSNVGMDFRVFDRVQAEIDYFDRRSSNLLFQVPLPASTGVTTIAQNIGEMVNRGIEFRVLADIFTGAGFRWNVDFNITHLQNEITKLPQEEIITGTKKLMVGRGMYDYWIREVAGIDPEDGRTMYWYDVEDENGNVTRETTKNHLEADRYYVGSAIPDFWGGITNNFTFGNFDLSVLVTYGYGGLMYDQAYSWLNGEGRYGYSLHSDRLDRWVQPGDVTDQPRMENGNTTLFSMSDMYLFDMSYIALKNLTFGYNIPQRLLTAAGISNLRLFVSGDNLMIWNENQGMDPQHSFTGVTDFNYVPVRTVTFGVNLNF